MKLKVNHEADALYRCVVGRRMSDDLFSATLAQWVLGNTCCPMFRDQARIQGG